MSADEGLQIGRRVKARRIAEAIRKLGGTVEDARRLTDGDWQNADQLSRTKPCPSCNRVAGLQCSICRGTGIILAGCVARPPSVETRALVLDYLARPDDSPRDEDAPPE